MTNRFSRRDFLKLGATSAIAAVLTGCGPAARYVTRKPYADMPEYNQTGMSTYFATTCRECPAGCGLIVRTFEGRAIKVEGNPEHPVNRGKLCSRGLTSVQGLYNPDRIEGPRKYHSRGNKDFESFDWDAAIQMIAEVFQKTPPDQVAFLLGFSPDHLFDLVSEIAAAIKAPLPIRYSAMAMFDGRATLAQATREVFGKTAMPFFDIAQADVVFSFGANFLETWLSPVAFSTAYSQMRRGTQGKRGYLVVFEPRMSMTAANADEWYPITPGSENVIVAALNKLVAQMRGESISGDLEQIDISESAQIAGVDEKTLYHLAEIFANAQRPLAIPGGGVAGHVSGLATMKHILTLNSLVNNLGQPGGVFLSPASTSATSIKEVADLVQRMKDGKVKVLFIHGSNPVFELPLSLDFVQALKNVPLVISFASFPDETALISDYILPDHTPLESWGYQRMLVGADRVTYSAFQPVVIPLHNTRATADVLIAAMNQVGRFPYSDEVDFVQQKLIPLLESGKGFYTAPELLTFWTLWLQKGGWWTKEIELERPIKSQPLLLKPTPPTNPGDRLFLVTYPTQLGDGSGANRPWLQETPDPMTTVTWNSWVEIHPETAQKLGIRDEDIIKITSDVGEIEAVAYLYPAIRPDTIAIPFGQGHTALGRYAVGRGCNPAQILEYRLNEAGDLAFGDTLVTITATGRRKPLARLESREGVYSKH